MDRRLCFKSKFAIGKMNGVDSHSSNNPQCCILPRYRSDLLHSKNGNLTIIMWDCFHTANLLSILSLFFSLRFKK